MMTKPSTRTAILVAVAILAFGVLEPKAQNREFEEIVVTFQVPRLLEQDLFVFYDGHDVFVPLAEVFGLLDINCRREVPGRRYSGFFISTDQRYQVDAAQLEINLADHVHQIGEADFFSVDDELYLRLSLYNSVFQMDMEFHFSVVAATHHVIAMHIMEALKVSFDSFFDFRQFLKKIDNKELMWQHHYEVYEAISNRDAPLAKRKIIRHLNFIERKIREGLEEIET